MSPGREREGFIFITLRCLRRGMSPSLSGEKLSLCCSYLHMSFAQSQNHRNVRNRGRIISQHIGGSRAVSSLFDCFLHSDKLPGSSQGRNLSEIVRVSVGSPLFLFV